MDKQYVGRDYTKETVHDKLTPMGVDSAAELHMPLCMKVRFIIITYSIKHHLDG